MDLLKIGQKLSLSFEKDSAIVEMICTLAKLKDDRIVIELPPYFMRYIEYLDVGCELTIKVFSKLGTIDFKTIVITSPLEDEFSVELDYNAIKLTPNSELPIINAMEILTVEQNETVLKMKTFEISTEYMKFYCDKTFQVGDNFSCKLVLPKNYGIISFVATVTDIDPVYTNEYTVTYSQMTENDRQLLLYYMYLYSNNNIEQEQL